MFKRFGLMRLIAFAAVFALMISPGRLWDKNTCYVTNAAHAEEEQVTSGADEAAEEAARLAEEEAARRTEEAARRAEEERRAREEEERRAEEEAAGQDEEEDEPEPGDDNTVITELEQEQESQIEELPQDEDEEDEEPEADEADDDWDDGEEYEEFDDDEVGSVSEDLLQQFNNPDSFEQVEFGGSADIELKNEEWDENWDGTVVLVAKVRNTSLSYRLVWEANDHDSRGWFTVGSGSQYSYTLTKENLEREANREYRVVMFTVD